LLNQCIGIFISLIMTASEVSDWEFDYYMS